MNKRKYVRPEMTEILVELEDGFMAASIVDKKDQNDVTIGQQEGGTDITIDGNSTPNGGWD